MSDRSAYIEQTEWVVDTSFLLQHPSVILEVPGNYVLTDDVLRQLDRLEESEDVEIRTVSGNLARFLNDLMDLTGKSLIEGIEFTSRNDPYLRRITAFSLPDHFIFPAWLVHHDQHDRIIAAAFFLMQQQDQGGMKSVGLVTKDEGMKMRARAFGVKIVNPYRHDAKIPRSPNRRGQPEEPSSGASHSDPGLVHSIPAFRFISSAFSKGMSLVHAKPNTAAE